VKLMYQVQKYKYNNRIEISREVIFTTIVLSFILPIFRSGGRSNLNFWEWVFNHTIFGPKVEYIPEEDYELELQK